MSDPVVIGAHSIYGAESRKGLVGITIGDRKPVYVTPEEARSIAEDILQAATAAETDEVVMRWLMGKLGVNVEQGAAILQDLRRFRAERRHEQSPVEHV